MELKELQYQLPSELIASRPLPDRSQSRMLHINRKRGSYTDKRFTDLPDILLPDDLVVVNNTKVIAARLLGRKQSGGQIELLLTEPVDSHTWWSLAKASRPFREDTQLAFDSATGVVKQVDGRSVLVQFSRPALDIAEQEGRVPLPPYIKRSDDSADHKRYQTVFAQQPGAVAAPTAALHFDGDVLQRLKQRGIGLGQVTLHVGPGTFLPVETENLKDHKMGSERFSIEPDLVQAIAATRARGGRVVAIGTTTTRALESVADDNRCIVAKSSRTDLFITPGHPFKVVDVLLTNFHLPGSTLIALVMALAGKKLVLDAYHHAVEQRYRFYSYGDCMIIE